MPRTVLWLMAAGAVVTTAVLGEAWRGESGEPAILVQAAKATASSPAAPAPSPPVDAATPQTAAPPSVRPPTVAMPSFDIALIGPDGRGVIAGRAQPGAKIILLDGDKVLAQDQADANGEWIIIAQDPPLSAGKHELRVIQHVDGRAPVTSDQVVVAIVPDQKQSGPEEKTLILISPSAGAAKLMQPPSAAGVPKSGDLVMSTLDYDEGGHITVTGKASPGAVVRAYINDTMVAEGQAAADGSWRRAGQTRRARQVQASARPARQGWQARGSPRAAVRAHSRAAGYGQQRTPGCRAWRQSLEHCAGALWYRLPAHPDLRRKQGSDPRSGPNLPGPSL